jgi:hypothetical protein
MKIFQYMDSTVSTDPEDDDNTRWIAADSMLEADALAAGLHWRPYPPGQHEIFVGSVMLKDLKTREDYAAFGCDMVIEHGKNQDRL